MAKEANKVKAIALKDLPEVMKEVTSELGPLLNTKISNEEGVAASIFIFTLAVLTLEIFDYLPPQQKDEILINCCTWFDIGMLLGRSPQLLVEILDKVHPRVEKVEIPDWLREKLAPRRQKREEG